MSRLPDTAAGAIVLVPAVGFYNFSGGSDAALRRSCPAGRNEHGKATVFPSPDAALGDEDSAARRPYLG